MATYTHSELVDLGHKYLMKTIKCSFAIKEISSVAIEIPDVIGFMIGSPATLLIECKTSRSDFMADKKKEFRKYSRYGMGIFRSFLCEPGVINVEDLPRGWGLLYVKNGRIRRVCGFKRNGVYANREFTCDRNLQAEWFLMGSCLRRMEIRDHLKDIYAGMPAIEEVNV